MGIIIYCVVLQLLISRENCYFSNMNKIEFKIEYVLVLEWKDLNQKVVWSNCKKYLQLVTLKTDHYYLNIFKNIRIRFIVVWY